MVTLVVARCHCRHRRFLIHCWSTLRKIQKPNACLSCLQRNDYTLRLRPFVICECPRTVFELSGVEPYSSDRPTSIYDLVAMLSIVERRVRSSKFKLYLPTPINVQRSFWSVSSTSNRRSSMLVPQRRTKPSANVASSGPHTSASNHRPTRDTGNPQAMRRESASSRPSSQCTSPCLPHIACSLPVLRCTPGHANTHISPVDPLSLSLS
ncbi:hypothetical protein OF83DRAFT_145404 [Amylostereum chailletii]|nr:hypothetical protein OF83DRAFT_145404 [Amylostereum chailletii]